MTYRRSRARLEFEAQLATSARQLQPLYKLAVRHGSGSRLLGVYYVFLFSQLEVYIKAIVEDAVKTLNTAPPAFDQIPDLMLGYILHKGQKLAGDYRNYSVSDDEGSILKRLSAIARTVASWSNGVTPPIFDASEILEKKKYPSPKNMPQLFRRLGVEKLWAMIGKSGKINGELLLTSLNDLRTEIAHEGKVPPGFSLSDYRDRSDQMRRLVAAIDRGIATHFSSRAIPRKTWNAEMC